MRPHTALLSAIFIIVLAAGCASAPAAAPADPTAAPTAAPTADPNAPSTVAGTILDAAGEPFADMPVQLFKNSGRDIVAETRTDADGAFEFDGIQPGTYRIRYDVVLSPTYVRHYYGLDFTVGGGSTVRQDLVHDR